MYCTNLRISRSFSIQPHGIETCRNPLRLPYSPVVIILTKWFYFGFMVPSSSGNIVHNSAYFLIPRLHEFQTHAQRHLNLPLLG